MRSAALPKERPAATEELPFDVALARHGLKPLRRGQLSTLQVNVGKVCNQACHHCHVEAGPTRTEIMPPRVAGRIIQLLAASPSIETLDITGGAPEINPSFRWLVQEAWNLGKHVIDRCNLTILLELDQKDLAKFLALHGVHIVASLPCYQKENVDRQRGRGVFDKSIEALLRLNALGYGRPGSGLLLDLVYNPLGPSLPPPQAKLEGQYKRELRRLFGVEFNQLLTITNMPIKRFAEALARSGQAEAYQDLLASHFNPATAESLMCRSLVSIGWDGHLYDCDFNQMLELGFNGAGGKRLQTIWDIESLQELEDLSVVTGSHCFGCTAGAGSSCSGALQGSPAVSLHAEK